MKLFLCGPTIGHIKNNIDEFLYAQNLLKSDGDHQVTIPHQLFDGVDHPKAVDKEEYKRVCAIELLSSDAIVLIDGYYLSKEALFLKEVGTETGIPIFKSVKSFLTRETAVTPEFS